MLNLRFAICLISAAACGSSDSDDDDDDDGLPPVQGEMSAESTAFFEHFHASRYSRAPEAAAALDAAELANPGPGRRSLDRALSHLWHVVEFRRDPAQDPAALGAEAATLVPLFEAAQRDNPDDPRVGCFLGTNMVTAGQQTQDAALVQRGLAVIDAAVAAWPEFNLFCRALVYDNLPADDPDFQKAVEAFSDNVDVCMGEPLDRARPDITPYLNQATDRGRKRACWNDWIAPHNAEGFYMHMGDVLVKAGRIEAARIAYRNVTLIREYPSWPFKAALAERMNSDLDARAALYRDADPSNDPPVGATGRLFCAYCHAATADEL